VDQRSVTERKILYHPVNVGWPENGHFSQGPAPFGVLVLEQMAPARSSEEDFAGAGYLEPFTDRFPGLNSFGSSHRIELVDYRYRMKPW
jgi:hypothetical protein